MANDEFLGFPDYIKGAFDVIREDIDAEEDNPAYLTHVAARLAQLLGVSVRRLQEHYPKRWEPTGEHDHAETPPWEEPEVDDDFPMELEYNDIPGVNAPPEASSIEDYLEGGGLHG